MTLRNRKLVRKPIGMLRVHDEERQDFDWVVDYFDGEEPAVAYRKAIQEFVRIKRHERNSLSPARLDRNQFGHMATA